MESSRRDLSNDMAEQRPILKNNLNTFYYHRFTFTPKTGVAFPKTGVLFTLRGGSILRAIKRIKTVFVQNQNILFMWAVWYVEHGISGDFHVGVKCAIPRIHLVSRFPCQTVENVNEAVLEDGTVSARRNWARDSPCGAFAAPYRALRCFAAPYGSAFVAPYGCALRLRLCRAFAESLQRLTAAPLQSLCSALRLAAPYGCAFAAPYGALRLRRHAPQQARVAIKASVACLINVYFVRGLLKIFGGGGEERGGV